MTFYKTTDQITETCDYKFDLPEFGESTTDPSYYEPQSTRIANMRKSASSASDGVYDFYDDPSSADLDEYHTLVGRKPGITFEEVSAMNEINNFRINANNKAFEESEKRSKKSKEDAIQSAKDLAAAIREDNPSGVNTSE